MAQPPLIRASDDDRQRVVDLLAEHHVAGRLDQAEFAERMESAYLAKTIGELRRLILDLPRIEAVSRRSGTARSSAARAALASWVSAAVLVLVIWLAVSVASGHFTYFWPFWIIGPWGAVLLFRAVDGLVKGPDGPQEH